MEIDLRSLKEILESLIEKLQKDSRTYDSYYIDLEQISQLNRILADILHEQNSRTSQSVSQARKRIDSLNEQTVHIGSSIGEMDIRLQRGIESSQQSHSALSEAMEEIRGLDNNFGILSKDIENLKLSIENISQRIGIINDVSDLTNLLALNAAIEAARAGEHGAGFSVVAKEIRNLADRSQRNTNEIKTVIQELGERIDSSDAALRLCHQAQERVRGNVGDTAERLEETSTLLSEAGDSLTEILSSSAAQREESREISQFMDTLEGRSKTIIHTADLMKNSLRSHEETLENFAAQNTSLQDRFNMVSEKTENLLEKPPAREITIGHDSAYPPWAFLNNGRPSGISVEMSNKIAHLLNYPIDFISSQWSNLFSALMEGRLTALTNVGWPNAAFDGLDVIASKPYETFNARLFMQASKIPESRMVEQQILEGKTVAVQKGSYIGESLESQGCRVLHLENDVQGMAKLIEGNVFAVAAEERVGQFLSDKFFQGTIEATENLLEARDVVFLLHRDSQALKEEIDGAIDRLREEI